MYHQELFVAGRTGAEFESALDAALAALDVIVAERVDLRADQRFAWARSLAARDDLRIEVPHICVHDVHESPSASGHIVSVDVRAVRSPFWNLGLARRLSHALQRVAGALVNDRLRDDYGYAFFFAGHWVEGAVRTRSGVALRFGIEGTDRDVFDRCEEHRNSYAFFERASVLADVHRGTLRPESRRNVKVFALESRRPGSVRDLDDVPLGSALGWTTAEAPLLTRATLAGMTPHDAASFIARMRAASWSVCEETIDPTYGPRADGSLDCDPVYVIHLASRSARDVSDLLAFADRVGCAISAQRFDQGATHFSYWKRLTLGGWRELRACGAGALIDAWSDVTARTQMAPVHWSTPS